MGFDLLIINKQYCLALLNTYIMKQIITILVTLFVSVQVFAQWQNNNNKYDRYNTSNNRTGSLTIQTPNTDGFYVSINDAYTHQSYNNSIVLNNINTSNTLIEVYTLKRNFWGQSRKVIVYRGNVYMQPGIGTNVIIDNWGRVNVSYTGNDYNGYDDSDNRWDKRRKHKKHHKHNRCGNDNRDRDYDYDDNRYRNNNRNW
jgi:hypothetical protein